MVKFYYEKRPKSIDFLNELANLENHRPALYAGPQKLKNMRKAQNLLEYILIAAMLAIAGYAFVSNFDMKALKNYVFMRPEQEDTIHLKDENGNDKEVKLNLIKIEAMTP